jgi:hypothetical protein
MRSISALVILLFCLPASARNRSVAKPPYVPSVGHVFVVVLENTDEAVAEELPFFRRLAGAGALLENYHGLAHPSQPNYIAMMAGSAYGITDDTAVTIDVPHLGDLLERRGLTWKTYAENYPGDCFTGVISGTQASGAYVRRHNPFIEFQNVQDDIARCTSHIVNAGELDADIASGSLPNFSFYIPNDQHNGHDSSAAAADAWLEQRFGSLINDPRFMNDMLFVVTYDESSTNANLSAVSAVIVGPAVRVGVESITWYDHYNLLRTIEATFGLPTLGKHDATAAPIADIWR